MNAGAAGQPPLATEPKSSAHGDKKVSPEWRRDRRVYKNGKAAKYIIDAWAAAELCSRLSKR